MKAVQFSVLKRCKKRLKASDGSLIDTAMLETAHNADFGSVTTRNQGWLSTGRWEEDSGRGQSI